MHSIDLANQLPGCAKYNNCDNTGKNWLAWSTALTTLNIRGILYYTILSLLYILCYTILYHTILDYIFFSYIRLYYTTPYHTISYHVISPTLPYHTTSYNTPILHYPTITYHIWCRSREMEAGDMTFYWYDYVLCYTINVL